MKKMIFLAALIMILGSAAAAAPVLDQVTNSGPVTAGAAITFTATLSSAGDGLNFKLYVCRDGSTSSCTSWCTADNNSTATTAQCSYTTSTAATRDYNAFVCDTNSTPQCSNVISGQFVVNAASDTTAPSVSVKDINGDTSSPYWARTEQPVKLVINIGESSGECKWSDSNWGASTYDSTGSLCATSGNDATCELGTKSQTTSTSNGAFYNCKDSTGNATGGLQVNYGVDYTAPTGSISTNVSGNSATSTYSGSDAHSGVQKYEVSLDGGSFTDKGTTTTHTFTSLSNADHNFTVRVVDNAGNTALFSDIKNVNFDSSAIGKPDINSSTHPEDVWTSNSSPQFTWTSASNASKYRYALTSNSDTIPDANNETTSTSTSFSGLSDAERWFHVRACNSSNTCGDTDHFRVRIDTTNPEPPTDFTGMSQSNASIFLSWGRPTDASGIKEYIIYRNLFEKVGTRDFVPSDTGVKKFEGITTTSFTDRNSLELGQVYYYRIRAIDNAGNQGSISSVLKVQNSGTSCQIEMSSNVPQFVKVGNLDITITITGGQISNATLRIKMPGGDIVKLLEAQKGTSITKQVTIPASAQGDGYVEVEGKDGNGAACKKQFNFTVDSTKPTVQIISPQQNSDVNGTVKIRVSAADSSGIKSVRALVDGKALGEMQKNGDNYEIEWNTGSVSAGSHTIAIEASDNAGNSSSVQEQVIVSNANESVFLQKNYSYNASNLEIYLDAAGVKPEFIEDTKKITQENAPKRSLLITKTPRGLRAQITITLTNSGTAKGLQAIEVIPKGVARNARDIESDDEFTIIQNDPIIKFSLGEVAQGGEASVTYTVADNLSESAANSIALAFDSFAAPPIILESDAANPIEVVEGSDDWLFWGFIAIVVIVIILIVVVVLGGGALVAYRHLHNEGKWPVKDKPSMKDTPRQLRAERKSKGKWSLK